MGEGLENVIMVFTTENQKRADERLPILLDLPFKHKGIMCAPTISEITLNSKIMEFKIDNKQTENKKIPVIILNTYGEECNKVWEKCQKLKTIPLVPHFI